jgi:hypothetical protein
MSEDIEPVSAPEPSAEASMPEVQSEPQSQAPEASPFDHFRSLPQFSGRDDREIASGLYQALQREEAASRALRQYQSIMPVAQDWLSHRSEFEKWRLQQQQQQQQPAAQDAAKKWWNPPEVKDSHRRYLIKDESGRDIISPDAPMDARASLTDWMNYRADFAQKFLTNPEDALGPMVAELAAKQAQELVEKQFQARDREAIVNQFEEENKDWLYEKYPDSVSPTGLAFHKYAEEARSYGIDGPQARIDYATKMIERDLLVQKYLIEKQQTQQQPQQPQYQPQQPVPQPMAPPQPPSGRDVARENMEYLRREASRNPSRTAGTANTDPRQPKPKRTFEEMLIEEASSRSML